MYLAVEHDILAGVNVVPTAVGCWMSVAFVVVVVGDVVYWQQARGDNLLFLAEQVVAQRGESLDVVIDAGMAVLALLRLLARHQVAAAQMVVMRSHHRHRRQVCSLQCATHKLFSFFISHK
jgi:hypothetical protein